MDTEKPLPEPSEEPAGGTRVYPKKMGVALEIMKLSLIALVIITPVRLFVAQPFIVSGASMHPTLEVGEYLVIDKISKNFDALKRGEVMVFRYPLDPEVYFVKRVVGLPGEVLKITGDTIAIQSEDGESFIPVSEPYVATPTPDSGGVLPKNATFTVTLEDDEYYMLGDNRPFSSDSRVWGPLKKKYFIGHAVFRLMPLSRMELYPGDYTFPDEE